MTPGAGRIRRLPDHLVNKIAAGEVVERPASVVKELVENALDAGARSVSVDLRDGGAALVRVTDDGIGMTAAELELALERHATSKLADDDDLAAIGTLGFRGEALPAICSVSRFAITTRARQAEEGTRVAGEAGGIAQRLAVPAGTGTTVEVSDLFFNTPARLKFLKSTQTELAATLRVLTHLAVAQPAVQFRVTSNGRAVLTAPAARDLRERVGALWGWDLAGRLLEVARTEHGVEVQGFAGGPALARGGRDDVVLVVNGRPVRDPTLFQAVLGAYRPLLPRDRFPLAVLALTVPLSDVDVNVHPTKAWVRFRHPRLIHELVAAALADALRRVAVVPASAPSSLPSPGATAPAEEGTEAGQGGEGLQPGLFAEAAPARYGGGADLGRVLGQVQDTFVVTASDTEVFFLDQHAAHERVLVERLEADVAAGGCAGQELLFPSPLALGPAGRVALERWREPLARLGFEFEAFGADAVILRSAPALLSGDEPRRLVEALVDDLAGARGREPVLDRVLAFVACRAAIKANTRLDREEMERLVADLGRTATPYFCPHGRPTMSRVALADVRRDVRRLW
jgi:DNA mismatch repair protein MutL